MLNCFFSLGSYFTAKTRSYILDAQFLPRPQRIRHSEQGRQERVRAPVKKKFFGLPPAKADRRGKTYANTAGSLVCNMAAGRKYRQHNKSLPYYVWYYQERQKHMLHIGAPGPLPDRRAPVICTGSSPSSKVTATGCHSVTHPHQRHYIKLFKFTVIIIIIISSSSSSSSSSGGGGLTTAIILIYIGPLDYRRRCWW
jgi:hypothetical protein